MANVLMALPIYDVGEDMINPKSGIDFMKIFSDLKQDFHNKARSEFQIWESPDYYTKFY